MTSATNGRFFLFLRSCFRLFAISFLKNARFCNACQELPLVALAVGQNQRVFRERLAAISGLEISPQNNQLITKELSDSKRLQTFINDSKRL